MLIVLVPSVDGIVETMTCPEQEMVLASEEANKNTKEAAAETEDCQALLLLDDGSLLHMLSCLLVADFH